MFSPGRTDRAFFMSRHCMTKIVMYSSTAQEQKISRRNVSEMYPATYHLQKFKKGESAMKILVVSNRKGGVGKTTASNLANELRLLHVTVMVDMDDQHDLPKIY